MIGTGANLRSVAVSQRGRLREHCSQRAFPAPAIVRQPAAGMGLGSRARQLWDGARRLPRGGVVAVTAGFLLHLSLGNQYTFGNLTTYLTSYLHVRLGLAVDYGDTVWVGTIQGLAQGPGVLLGSMCYRRIGPRLTILIGSVLLSSGMALTCLAVQTSFATTLLTYGLLSGFGVGLAYTSPLMVGYRWFPRNHGLVSGIVVGGYGLGGIIFTSVQTAYLNPENVSPEEDGFFHDAALLDRVPSMFLVQAAICAGLQVCGVLGVHPPPVEYEAHSDHTRVKDETSTQDDAGSVNTDEGLAVKPTDEDESVGEAPGAWKKHLLTVQNMQLMLAFVMNAYGLTTVNSFWKAFGQTFIKNDHFLAMVGVGSSVFNMLGRVFWGLVCDASSYKPTMILLTGLLGALVFTLPSTALVGQAMFLVWVWAIFFCVAGTFSVVVTGTAATFGVQHAGHIYGVIFIVTSLCSPLVAFIADVVLDRFSFPGVYLVGGGFVCVGLAATLTFRPRRRDQRLANDVEITAL